MALDAKILSDGLRSEANPCFAVQRIASILLGTFVHTEKPRDPWQIDLDMESHEQGTGVNL